MLKPLIGGGRLHLEVCDINCALSFYLFSRVVIEKTWALEQMDRGLNPTSVTS